VNASVQPTGRVAGELAFAIDQDDLASRLALAAPNDTCKGMFFNGVFRAMARAGAVEPEAPVSPTGKKAKKQSEKYVDFFNYPIAEFLPLVWRAAELIGGGRSSAHLERGVRELGRQATDDFLSTAVGKTLLMLAGSDPRRLMSSLASGYKTAVSYGVRALEWQGQTQCLFTMRRDFMPHPYHEGVLLQVLGAIGARGLSVKGTRVGLLDTDYLVAWEARP
jgi:uncharacterized protein (TIGR02265 family)